MVKRGKKPGPKTTVFCNECGKPKEILAKYYEESESKRFFCNQKCMTVFLGRLKRGKPLKQQYQSVLVCCTYCGYPRLINWARYEKQETFFCGYECQARWRSKERSGINSPLSVEKVRVKCATCGKEKEVIPYVAKLHERHYCDRWCQGAWKSIHQRGENSGMWKGGTSEILYPPEWTPALRRKIRERDEYTCQICGATEEENGEVMDVHHIDYNKLNCKEKNLISLCHNKCHGRTNGSTENRVYWQKFFKSVIAFKYFRRRDLKLAA